MKLAFFSPLSPIRSGISTYSEELLPYLADRAEIDLFVDDYVPTNPVIVERFFIYSRAAYGPNRWVYDAAIYHLGNNMYHEGIYRSFLDYPGIVVLHDFFLHGLTGGITLARGDKIGYVREMAYCDRLEGSRRGWRIASRREAVTDHSHPLNQRVLDLSLGVIVHSDYVRSLVLRANPQVRVAKVNMGMPLPPLSLEARQRARRVLGLTPDDLLFASFGFLTPEKRIEVVLAAFARLLQDYPTARYVIVGQASAGYQVSDVIRSLGLEERVTVTGYLSFDDYQQVMYAADVAVNLRYPTAGETLASVLRLLSVGVPTIVSDVGWFAELPDDCCRKVAPDEEEVQTLWRQMASLAGDEKLRCALGREARDYLACHHSLKGAAEEYIAFIQAVLDDL